MRIVSILAAILVTIAALPARAAGSSLTVAPYFFQTFGPEHTEADLGHLTVPELRAQRSGRTIDLAFVRFKSTSTHPGTPIVYLGGGIGNGITAARTIRFRFFDALRSVADVIVLDQRGSGMSTPSLQCGRKFGLPLDQAATPSNMLAGFSNAALPCIAQLRTSGLNLAAYNANESADDVEALRAALGVPRVSLLAISYGTTLALNIVKRHPGSVERVVLAGVEAPDDTYKLPSRLDDQLTRIGTAVRNNSEVASKIPDFKALFAAVLAKLQQGPQTATVTDRKTHETHAVTVGAFDLQYYTVYEMGDTYMTQRLPADIYKMSNGDYTPLAERAYAFRNQGLDSILRLTLDCASGESNARAAEIAGQESGSLLGAAANFPFPAACAAIGNPDLGAAYREPLRTTTPALFISGTLDGKTPPENAAQVAAGFSNATQLIIDGAGHSDDLFSSSPQIEPLVATFLSGTAVHSQTIVLPPLKFEAP